MKTLRDTSRRRRRAHQRLRLLGSRVYAAFLEMEAATVSEGALPVKVKELVAVGVAVVTDCESCMQWHIEKAADAGATELEILEAVELVMEMGGGRATVSARFALKVMEDVFQEAEVRPSN